MFQLLFTDLDGTLFRGDHLTFSQRTADALLRLKESGAKLCISTGRVQCTLPPTLSQVDFDFAITCNGSVCRDLHSGEKLFSAYLSEKKARAVRDICRRFHPFTAWYVDGQIILDQEHYDIWPEKLKSSWHQAYMRTGQCRVYRDISEYFDEGAPQLEKINLCGYPPLEHLPMLRMLEDTGFFELASSIDSTIEVSDCSASKGAAVQLLCRKLGIVQENCVAFGDGDNDISMIRSAGVGVAMGNSIPQLKQAADAVTLSNDEDGIAVFLEKYL